MRKHYAHPYLLLWFVHKGVLTRSPNFNAYRTATRLFAESNFTIEIRIYVRKTMAKLRVVGY